jgi:hypothetical protein
VLHNEWSITKLLHMGQYALCEELGESEHASLLAETSKKKRETDEKLPNWRSKSMLRLMKDPGNRGTTKTQKKPKRLPG